MILKEYQKKTLDVLQDYLERCRLAGPADAYRELVNEPEQKRRLGRYAQEYSPLESLPNIPYVCLRLPTGGGKTILASWAIGIARDAWVEKDYPTVLWLVPTKTIGRQTAEALKDPRHPYRRQMDEKFEGRVRVFDIGDFAQIRPQDIRDNLTVIVGTIQSLRVADTEGRKVYAHNEEMEPHFTRISNHNSGLEKQNGSDDVKFSFANLLHTLHPIMIVDEAHNAVTGLTREMQERVSPSCIIEFSATPRLHSNTLHSVTAQEVKDEDMIKLPIVLGEHPDWQSAVDAAIQRRQELANAAKKDSKYIRPIVLFRAQKKNEEVNVEVLKKYLTDTSGIAKKKIAIATGAQREIDDVDLFDEKCPIEFVITVEALKEGWDCSFAYVFCSVTRIQSTTAVEQLLGRVLRMPFAERREQPELNRAYAEVSEPSFAEAATALRDKLVHMGFDEEEASFNIEQALRDEDQFELVGGEFGGTQRQKPTITETIHTPVDVSEIADEDQNSVSVSEAEDGQLTIKITGHVSDETISTITAVVPEAAQEDFREKVAQHKSRVEQELAPAAKGVSFAIPKLMFKAQGELEFADFEVFDELSEWSLLDYPAKLDENEFSIQQEANTWEIDLDGRRVVYSLATQEEQLSLDVDVEGWTLNSLALALDKLVADPRFSQADRLKWCLDHVSHLVNDRGLSLSSLWRAKFILARKLSDRVKEIKAEEANKSYQKHLFAPDAKPDVSFENSFNFSEHMYDGQRPYRGNYAFRKHFLDFVPYIDGGERGEEFKCAMAIDTLPETKHWLRNISKHPASFRLPLAQHWTYPDFVAELDDGRLFVIEYKGAHILHDPDTREKKLIGELWEKSMGGKGLYLMAVKDDNGKDVRAQLAEKVR